MPDHDPTASGQRPAPRFSTGRRVAVAGALVAGVIGGGAGAALAATAGGGHTAPAARATAVFAASRTPPAHTTGHTCPLGGGSQNSSRSNASLTA